MRAKLNQGNNNSISFIKTFQTNDETQEMDKLNNVMKRLETSDSPSEVDKINDLIKVSFQMQVVQYLH